MSSPAAMRCPKHQWQPMPCATCQMTRRVAQPSRVTPLGTLPTLYVGEPTFADTGGLLTLELVADRNEGIGPENLRPADGNIQLWWRCGNEHHQPYQATVGQRVRKGVGCPECTGTPRAEYIWRIVKALAAGELSEVAALAILARHGIVKDDAEISGPIVKGLLAAVRDEGLLDAIDTDPEEVLTAVETTVPPTVEEVTKALSHLPTVVPTTPEAPEPVVPKTEEEALADIERILDKAENVADALVPGGILADLLGDDADMTERLIREIEADLWQAAMSKPREAEVTAKGMEAKGGRHAEAAGTFLRMLAEAESLAIPGLVHTHKDEEGNVVPTHLRLSQRRAVVTLAERGHVLNAMTVGGGKTLAAIAAGMHEGIGRAVVVCPAPLADQWAEQIVASYGPHAVEVHRTLTSRSMDDRPDWWVLSVDTFSNPNNEADLTSFAIEVGADYLVIDEVHKAKQRASAREGTDPVVSARSQRLRTFRAALAESNPNLLVMGMTGTPTLNDLSEPISLLELVTGERMAEIGTRATPGNVALVSLELRRHGIVTLPSEDLSIVDPVRDAPSPTKQEHLLDPAAGFVTVDLSRHLGDLLVMAAVGTRSGLPVETMVLADKAEAFADHVVTALAEDRALDSNAVIVAFTRHVDAVNDEKIVSNYAAALRAKGLVVRTFTAADRIPNGELSKEALGCDVVIGTAPMGTGVDGLQKHARRLIILSAPWTWAEHEQVVGRLARTGQKHEVTVNPVVGWFDLPSGKRVSLEAIDLMRVIRKKRLADAVLYGILPAEVLPDEAEVLTALVDWQTEVDAMLAELLDPSLLFTPASWWDIYEKMVKHMSVPHASGALAKWHATWFHETTGTRWNRDTRERAVVNYGRTLEVARMGWAVDPVNTIANRLRREARGRTVVDAGCSAVSPHIALALDGTATVKSYDMASEHPLVQVADVTALPEDDESADYYVLCQAIMGTNSEDYLREAHRVLHWNGILYLAETGKHFGEDVDAGIVAFRQHLRSLGFATVDVERIGADPEFVVIKAMKNGPAAATALEWQWAHLGGAA